MRDWLGYSPSTGNVYCYVCKLFRSGSDSFSLNGFNDWVKCAHERSDSHLVAVKKGFKNAKAHHVDSAITNHLENKQQYWIELLKRIVAVVTFLAERGHPFRGHTELFGQKDNGNYLSLLE